MFITGGISPASLSIAGTLAGSQRADADVERTKSDAAGKRAQADQVILTSGGPADVGEAEMSADRDADGTLFYDETGTGEIPTDAEPAEELASPPVVRSLDADRERGTHLDLDA